MKSSNVTVSSVEMDSEGPWAVSGFAGDDATVSLSFKAPLTKEEVEAFRVLFGQIESRIASLINQDQHK